MSERLESLLDELARRHASGEELDVAGLLTEAGDEADAFASLADRLLQAAPRREPTQASLAYVAALAEPPLLRLRVQRQLRFGAVVKELATALRVTDVGRLERYYHRLEGGLLDPEPVDGRVWGALERALGAPARALALSFAGGPKPGAVAYYREPMVAMSDASVPVAPDAVGPPPTVPGAVGPPPAAPEELDPPPAARDELDRLFLGGG